MTDHAQSMPCAATRPAPTRQFAEAMSALAGSVVLVTCRIGGRPWGMTVTAFASVSADPPTVLVSLGSETRSARVIAAGRTFGVSILGAQHVPIARLGSAAGAAKYIEPFVDEDAHSLTPAVRGALAHLDCIVEDALAVGDHTIFIGLARAVHATQGGAPLLYHRRSYSTGRTLECPSISQPQPSPARVLSRSPRRLPTR